MGYYKTAQVCLNGHQVVSDVESSPELTEKFCTRCGRETITSCPSCSTKIRGYYESSGFPSLADSSTPSYCHECGIPYPWTAEKINAAMEMVDELDGLNEEEIVQLKGTLADISQDTSRTEVATFRFKKLLAKAGKEAGGVLRNIVVDVASETAKKLLL